MVFFSLRQLLFVVLLLFYLCVCHKEWTFNCKQWSRWLCWYPFLSFLHLALRALLLYIYISRHTLPIIIFKLPSVLGIKPGRPFLDPTSLLARSCDLCHYISLQAALTSTHIQINPHLHQILLTLPLPLLPVWWTSTRLTGPPPSDSRSTVSRPPRPPAAASHTAYAQSSSKTITRKNPFRQLKIPSISKFH